MDVVWSDCFTAGRGREVLLRSNGDTRSQWLMALCRAYVLCNASRTSGRKPGIARRQQLEFTCLFSSVFTLPTCTSIQQTLHTSPYHLCSPLPSLSYSSLFTNPAKHESNSKADCRLSFWSCRALNACAAWRLVVPPLSLTQPALWLPRHAVYALRLLSEPSRQTLHPDPPSCRRFRKGA